LVHCEYLSKPKHYLTEICIN